MAHKKLMATAELFLNTKDAKKDAKIFINDLKQKLTDIESAADKMTVFKDMVGYIAQVDKALSALKAKNKDAFNNMFDGLDTNLKKQLEGVFGIDGSKLGQLGVLRDTLDGLTDKSSIKEIRDFAKSLNEVYESIGSKAPFADIENEFKDFSKGAKTKYIDVLSSKLNNFATVWKDVNSKISQGFGVGVGGEISALSKEVQNEIDKLKKQEEEMREVFDAINNPQKVKVQLVQKSDNQVAQLKSLKEAFIAAADAKKHFESTQMTGTPEYLKAVAKYIQAASKVKSAFESEKLTKAGNEWIMSSGIGTLQDSDNVLNKFVIENEQLIDKVKSMYAGQIGDIEAQVTMLFEKPYDVIKRKVASYAKLQSNLNREDNFSDDELNDITAQIKVLDKYFFALDKVGDKGKKINDVLSGVAFGDIDNITAVDKLCRMLGVEIPQAAQKAEEALRSVGDSTIINSPEIINNTDEIKDNTDEMLTSIDYAKKELTKAWQEYYKAAQRAANDYDLILEDGETSQEMDRIKDSIDKKIESFGATAADPTWGVKVYLDLADAIADGDIDADGIEGELDKLIKQHGISFDIPVGIGDTDGNSITGSITTSVRSVVEEVQNEVKSALDLGLKEYLQENLGSNYTKNDSSDIFASAKDEIGKIIFNKNEPERKVSEFYSLWNAISGVHNNTALSDIKNGLYANGDGEKYNISELVDFIEDIEVTYSESLDNVKEYLKSLYTNLRFDDSVMPTQVQNFTNFDEASYFKDVKNELGKVLLDKNAPMRQHNAYSAVWNLVSGVHNNTWSGSVDKGKYVASDGEEYDITDVIRLIDEIRETYGDNLDKVKEYLKNIYPNLEFDDSVIGNSGGSKVNGARDVLGSFKELVDYISNSEYGSKPNKIFDKISAGAQNLDDELQDIIKSLNLIDEDGDTNLSSIKSGYINKGGFVSDKYTMIARPMVGNNGVNYLSKAENLQEKLQAARQAGAQVGAIFDLIKDESHNLFYEIQNTVPGTAAFSHHNYTVNKDVAYATEEQLADLVNTMKVLSENGLFIDFGGDNILYDKDKGFSIIDLGLSGGQYHTVSKNNTLQENLDRFISEYFKFAPADVKPYVQMALSNPLYNIAQGIDASIVNPNMPNKKTNTNNANTKQTISNINAETSAHEQNTDAIDDEAAAMEALIKLKEKAQNMKWKDFAKDESLTGLKDAAGFTSLSQLEKFWKQSRYAKKINFHEISKDEAEKIFNDKLTPGLANSWYSSQQKFEVKDRLENEILQDDEIRNAALSYFYHIYKEKMPGKYKNPNVKTFEDFLNTEFTMYRGEHTNPLIYGDESNLTVSLSESVAKGFGGNIGTVKLKPKDTIGNAGSHYDNELETFAPNVKDFSWFKDTGETFEEFYSKQTKEMQEEINAGLINLEKRRVQDLLDENIGKLTHKAGKDFDFKYGILQQFHTEGVPNSLDITGDGSISDQFANAYNALSDMDKKLVAYFATLESLSKILPGQFSQLSMKEITKDDSLFNAILSDPIGVKKHVAGLTGESNFGIFQNAKDINVEANMHKLNAQAIEEEKKAQEALNQEKEKLVRMFGSVSDQLHIDANGKDSYTVREISDIWDGAKSISKTYDGQWSDPNLISMGGYVDHNTGEISKVKDLIHKINEFMETTGIDLSYVQDYISEIYKNADINEIDNMLKSYYDITSDKLKRQVESSRGGGDKFNKLASVWHALKDVDFTSKSSNIGWLINDGEYSSGLTGEVLQIEDLYNSISEIEYIYGENLQYVKDYLNSIYKQYNQKPIIPDDNLLLLDDDDLLIDLADSVNKENENINAVHENIVNELMSADGYKAELLSKLESHIIDLKFTDESVIDSGYITKGADGHAVTIESVYALIDEIQQQYNTNLSDVKECLDKVFETYHGGFVGKSKDVKLKLLDNLHSKQLSDSNAYDDVLKLYEMIDGLSSALVINYDDGTYLPEYNDDFQSATDILDLIKQLESQYGENLDYIKSYLQTAFNTTDLNNFYKNKQLDGQYVSDKLLNDYMSSTDKVADRKLYSLWSYISDVGTTDKEVAENGQVKDMSKDSYYDIESVYSLIDDIQQQHAINLGYVSEYLDQVYDSYNKKSAADSQQFGEKIKVKKTHNITEPNLDDVSDRVSGGGYALESTLQQTNSILNNILTAASVDGGAASGGYQQQQVKTPDPDPEDLFNKNLSNKTNVFNKYKTDLEGVEYITDALNTEIDELGKKLQQIDNQGDLDGWTKQFDALKDSVNDTRSVFEQENNGKINLYQKELSNSFNKLPMEQREELFDEYSKAILLINQQKQAVKDGHAVELDGIKQITAALQEEINKRLEANKAAKDEEKTKKKNAKFGDTAMINASAKYNSLRQTAESDQFANSTEVSKALEAYTAAYENMKNMRATISSKDDITSSDKESFKAATTECNNYGKELDKLIKNSLKLHNERANQEERMLGADFNYSDVESRKAALADFAKELYGVNLSSENFKKNFSEAVFAVQNSDGTFTQMTARFTDARNEIVSFAGDTKKHLGLIGELWDQFKGKLKSIFTYLVASFSLHRVWSVIKQGVQYVREIDSALTELKKVTDETEASYDRFLQTASKTAGKLGSTVADFVNATADFARLGYNLEQASKLAEAASVYKNVGDGITDVTQASESIISTMKAFGIEANNAMGIVDRFNEIGNNFAISSTGIGEAMQRSASALYESGNTIDESIALITAANSVIQNPEQVGTALKTLALRLRGAKTELEEAGEDVDGMATSTSQLQEKLKALTHGKVDIMLDEDTFKNTTQILREMSQAWEDMTDIERASALELMGGKRQANILSSVIKNFDTVEDVIETSMDSTGSALRENEKYLDSIQGRIDLFNNSLQTMWMNFIDSETVKNVVDTGTTLVKFLDTAHGKLIAISAVLAGIAKFKFKVNFTDMFKNVSGNLTGKDAMAIALQKVQSISGAGAQAIDKYVLALKDLSAAEQAQVLASKGLAESEQLAILTRSTGSEVAAKQAIAEVALAQTKNTLNVATIGQMVNTGALTAEQGGLLAETLGLTGAEAANVVVTKEDAKAKILAAMATDTQNKATYELILSLLGLNVTEGATVTTTNLLTAAMQKLWATLKANPAIVAAAIVAGLAWAFDKLHTTVEEASEAAKDSFDKIQSVVDSTKSNIQSLESELSTLQAQIEELSGKELSFADQENLNYMKEQEASLQRQLETQNSILKAQEESRNKQAISAVKAYTKASTEGAEETIDAWKTGGTVVLGILGAIGAVALTVATAGAAGIAMTAAAGVTAATAGAVGGGYLGNVAGEAIGSSVANKGVNSYEEWYKTYTDAIEAARADEQKALEKYEKDTSNTKKLDKWKEAQQRTIEIETEMYEHLSQIESMMSQVDYGEGYDEQLDEWYNFVDKISIQNGSQGAVKNALDRIFGENADEVVKAYKNKIENDIENGKAVDFQAMIDVTGLDDDLEELGITTTDVADYFTQLGEVGSDAIEEIDVSDLISELAKIEGALKSVQSVMEEFRTEGIVSASTLDGMDESIKGLGGVWENYVNTMMSGTATMADVKVATDKLAKAYLENNANNINKYNRLTYIAQLENLDVKNAAELVDSYLNNSFWNSAAFKNFNGDAEELIELAKEYGVVIEDTAKAEELLIKKQEAKSKQEQKNASIISKATAKRNEEKQEIANKLRDTDANPEYKEFQYLFTKIKQVENREGFFKNYTEDEAEFAINAYKNQLVPYLEKYGYTLEDAFPTFEVVPEIIVSEKEVNDAAKEYQDALDKMKLTVTPEVDLDPRNQLENMADWEGAIKSLSGVYNELLDDGKVSAGSLVGLADTFDIVGAKEEYEEFVNILSTAKSDTPEVRDAFENLTAAYLVNSGALEDVTEETEAMTVAKLKEMGVINAEAVAHKALLINQMQNITSIGRLKDATDEQVESEAQAMVTLAAEADVALTTADAINTLKYYRELYNIEDITSVTLDEANSLLALAKSAGIAAEELVKVEKIRDFIANKDQMRSDFFKSKNPGNNYVYTSMAKLWDEEFEKTYSEQLKQLYANVGTEYTPPNFEEIIRNSLGGLDFSGLFGDAANGGSDSNSELDWLDHYFTEIENEIKKKEAELENVVVSDTDTLSAKNTIIDEIIDLYDRKMSTLKAAMNAYNDRASTLFDGFSSDIQDKILNGSIDINEYDGDLAEDIQNYFDYITKASDLEIEIGGIKVTITDLNIQQIDNAYDSGSVRATVEASQTEKLQNAVDFDEARGLITDPSYYAAMMENSSKTVEYLTAARNKMQKEFNDMLADGMLTNADGSYNDKFYQELDKLYKIDSEIDQATIELENFQNAINDIYWESFDEGISRIDYLNEEAQGLIDLMSNEDMVFKPDNEDGWGADDVSWTDEGLATLGLHAQNMERAEEKAKWYGQAINDLTAEYEAGHYSESEYYEKLNELTQGQYDAIKAAQDEKDAIVELNKQRVDAIKDGIEKEIDAYEELIEKKKEELSAEKDLYDFQKETTDKQKNIADIERKLAALANDNSMSAVAKRKQLEADLAEAKEELEDSYYNRSIDNQQDALDKELDNFKEQKEAEKEQWEKYLEDIEAIVSESLGIVQANADAIGQTLTEKSTEYGVTISDAVLNPWTDGLGAIDDYTKKIGDSVSPTTQALDLIRQKWQEIKDELKLANEEADKYYNKNMATANGPSVDEINTENKDYYTYEPPAQVQTQTTAPATQPQQPQQQQEPQYTTYTVKSGDNLSHIAQSQLGSSSRWGEIYNLNRDIISNPNLIYPGQQLKLPKYAKGTTGVKEDQLALIDELGEEIVMHAQNGKLAYLTKGSSVIPHDISENLMQLGQLDPSNIIDENRPSIGIHPEIHNTEINLSITYGDMVSIGEYNGGDIKDLEKMVAKQFEKHTKDLNNAIRKYSR